MHFPPSTIHAKFKSQPLDPPPKTSLIHIMHITVVEACARLLSSPPTSTSFTLSIKACAQLSLLRPGISLHCLSLRLGLHRDPFVHNSLISLYMRCGAPLSAQKVFDQMPHRTTVSWNALISGFLNNGLADAALLAFDRMRRDGFDADAATAVSVLPACARLRDLRKGREVHSLVRENGFEERTAVANSLIDMYAKCGRLEEAQSIFSRMAERDVVSWTALIVGCVFNGCAVEALEAARRMRSAGVMPNSVTLAALLSACADLNSVTCGKCMHGLAVRNGFELDVIVETALIDMYAKCGALDLGCKFLMIGPRRRTAPWNALISGHSWNGLAVEAIVLFRQMQLEQVDLDVATLISLLPAYAEMADMQQAINIHGYIIRAGFEKSIEVATGLIDVYSKSGNLNSARYLFDKLPEKDIVSWSALIAGYGMHGNGRDAISLFNCMLQNGVKPNMITYTSVLYACSHAGLVDEGLHFFNSMVKDCDTKPRVDHYACMVDLLGRAGRLKEAYLLIKTMALEPNHAVWGALLGACVVQGDVPLGEVAAHYLFELEPDNTGNYVLLANIYAAVGRWEDVEIVRNMMNERRLRKMPGCSVIEVRDDMNAPLLTVS